MSDLINRQQAIDVLEEQLDYLFMLNKKDNPTAESKWCGVNWARNTIAELPTIEERKVGHWIRTGRTNVYGGEELMCPFCDDRVMVQNIEYELYCRNCGALLGDRAEGEE